MSYCKSWTTVDLTDGQGRTVDFRNVVVIMTSNLGSTYITSAGKGNDDEMRMRVMEALRANFRPEFLNRIDETVIFTALSRDQIGQILDIQIATIAKRLADRHISIQLTPGAKEWLAQPGLRPRVRGATVEATPPKRSARSACDEGAERGIA